MVMVKVAEEIEVYAQKLEGLGPSVWLTERSISRTLGNGQRNGKRRKKECITGVVTVSNCGYF